MTLDEAMGLALGEAAAAAGAGDVPVGAVVLDAAGDLLATGRNRREELRDPTAHAELLALRGASAATGSWRLTGSTVVATLEPCPMCAGALLNARVAAVAFGAPDPKAGACGTLYNLCVDPRLNHELAVTPGIRQEECAAQLSAWFAGRRGR